MSELKIIHLPAEKSRDYDHPSDGTSHVLACDIATRTVVMVGQPGRMTTEQIVDWTKRLDNEAMAKHTSIRFPAIGTVLFLLALLWVCYAVLKGS